MARRGHRGGIGVPDEHTQIGVRAHIGVGEAGLGAILQAIAVGVLIAGIGGGERIGVRLEDPGIGVQADVGVGEAGLGYELRRSAPVAMLRLTVDQLALLASDRLEKAEMAELRAALQWPTGEAQRAFGY